MWDIGIKIILTSTPVYRLSNESLILQSFYYFKVKSAPEQLYVEEFNLFLNYVSPTKNRIPDRIRNIASSECENMTVLE